MLSHAIPPKASLWPLLLQIDVLIRDEVQARGCATCGGRLDRADYDRKPRGGPPRSDDPSFHRRLSLCCAREGCRRRTQPPSARFLGRRVYLRVIVTLVVALRQGPTRIGMKKIAEVFDVDRRTVKRWGQWWRDMSSKSAPWRERLGRLTASDEPAPRRFILAFDAFEDPGEQSSLMLFFTKGVASTSTNGAGQLDGMKSTQKMPAVSP